MEADRWFAEWDGNYRDTVRRRFLRGSGFPPPHVAERMLGGRGLVIVWFSNGQRVTIKPRVKR